MTKLTFRIGMWAAAGLVIAIAWGLYFTVADKATPIEPLVYVMARLTQPVVALIVSYLMPQVGLRAAVATNMATYALVGLIIETVRKRFTNTHSVL